MTKGMDSDKRVINGSHGTVWLSGEEVGEAYGLKASSKFSKEQIKRAGVMTVGHKTTSIENTGSLMMHKTNSRMASLISEKIKKGEDPRFTIVTLLDDPDAYGAERVALYDVSFDDVTLADWEAGAVGKVESAFTFGDYKFLDKISVR